MCAWSQLGLRDKADAPRKVGTAITTKQAKAERTNTKAELTFERRHCHSYMHTCRNGRVCVCVCVGPSFEKRQHHYQVSCAPTIIALCAQINQLFPTYFTFFSSLFFCNALFIYLFYNTRIFRSFQRELFNSLCTSVCFRFWVSFEVVELFSIYHHIYFYTAM